MSWPLSKYFIVLLIGARPFIKGMVEFFLEKSQKMGTLQDKRFTVNGLR